MELSTIQLGQSAEVIAQMSVDKIAAQLEGMALAETPKPDLVAAAIEQKVTALLALCEEASRKIIMPRTETVEQLLYMECGGQTVSALQIIDAAQRVAYAVHINYYIPQGFGYSTFCERYNCDEAVQKRLYERAQTIQGSLVSDLRKAAEAVKQRGAPTTASYHAIIKDGLEMYAKHYPASHIVTQYCLSHGIPDISHANTFGSPLDKEDSAVLN